MKYRKWIYHDGALIVEKFIGELKKEDILKSDHDLFEGAPSKTDLLNLADITDATFYDIKLHDIKELIDHTNQFTNKFSSIKIALVTSTTFYEEFEKVYNYTLEASKNHINAMLFHSTESALEWLGIPDKERLKIISDLEGLELTYVS